MPLPSHRIEWLTGSVKMSLATELFKNSNTGWWVRKNNLFTWFCINVQVFGDEALQSINETSLFHNPVMTVFHMWRNLAIPFLLRLWLSVHFYVLRWFLWLQCVASAVGTWAGCGVTHPCPDLLVLGINSGSGIVNSFPFPPFLTGGQCRMMVEPSVFSLAIAHQRVSTGVGTNFVLMMALSQQKFSLQRWPCLSCSMCVKLEFKAPHAEVLGLSRSKPKGCTVSSWYVECVLIAY